MGPLEQAGAPDQEPVEPHGTSRGSRSKDNGSLELVALNQQSMRLLDIIAPGARWSPIARANWPLEQKKLLNQ